MLTQELHHTTYCNRQLACNCLQQATTDYSVCRKGEFWLAYGRLSNLWGFLPRTDFWKQVAMSLSFVHLPQLGLTPSSIPLYPLSIFVMVYSFSGTLLDSISMPGIAVFVLPLNDHAIKLIWLFIWLSVSPSFCSHDSTWGSLVRFWWNLAWILCPNVYFLVCLQLVHQHDGKTSLWDGSDVSAIYLKNTQLQYSMLCTT